MASKLYLYFLVCVFTAEVAGYPSVRVRRSTEDSVGSSSSEEDALSLFAKAFKKTKDNVFGAFDKIQHSDTYQNTKQGLSNIADKAKEVGDNIADKAKEVGENIRESHTYQNVKTSISDAADKIKDKVKETLDD